MTDFTAGLIVGACLVLIVEGVAWLIYLWTH
jgi:uncharacterized protein YjeT (DUF2065 family)